MTKSQLVDALAQRLGLPRAAMRLAVDRIFEAFIEALERGERIDIRGFGSFQLREYKGYAGHNPRTGAPITVPRRLLPYFRAGKALSDQINRPVPPCSAEGSSSATRHKR